MWTKREDWDSNSTTEATFQTIRETVQVYERYYHVSQSLWHFHRTNEFRCNDWRQLKEYRSIPQAHGQMTDCNKTIPLLNFLLWKNTKFRGEGGGRRGWGNYASKLTTQSGKLTVGRFSPMKSRDRYENYIRLLKRAGTGCIGSIRFPATFLPLLVEWCWKVAVFFFSFFLLGWIYFQSSVVVVVRLGIFHHL